MTSLKAYILNKISNFHHDFGLLLLYCQALSISQSLNLSLSLRDRDRADTTANFLST